jgi:hypothetical protein
MVDRLVNIQLGVKGLTNLLDPSVRILAASVADRTTKYQTLRARDRHENNGCSFTLSGGLRSIEAFNYNRTPWVPVVSDIVPRVNPKGLVQDASSIVDLIALILQRVKAH